MCYSQWEKQLLLGIMGKLKRQQSDFSIIWKLSSAKILGDMLSTASQLELRRGKKGPWHIWSVFSRPTICGKARKAEMRRGWCAQGGCRRRGLHPPPRTQGISRAFCLRAFITLANARQAAWDLRSPSYLKALTHADHGVGHLLLSLINGCQGEPLLHVWVWLEVQKSHMLLMKANVSGRFGLWCQLLHVMRDRNEPDQLENRPSVWT